MNKLITLLYIFILTGCVQSFIPSVKENGNNLSVEMRQRQDRALRQSPKIPEIFKDPIDVAQIYATREANKQMRNR